MRVCFIRGRRDNIYAPGGDGEGKEEFSCLKSMLFKERQSIMMKSKDPDELSVWRDKFRM